jgi:hypothetical protein
LLFRSAADRRNEPTSVRSADNPAPAESASG